MSIPITSKRHGAIMLVLTMSVLIISKEAWWYCACCVTISPAITSKGHGGSMLVLIMSVLITSKRHGCNYVSSSHF